MVLHGSLQQIHTLKAVCDAFRGEKHDHGGTAADQDGVDEDAQCLRQTNFGRVVCLRSGSGTRSGAGACLIGEKTSLNAVHHHCAEAAGGNLT